ncbi:hypothetical protein BKA61DRAFT_222356 [Leptodontidium sp. MPI-SDFR-AT-0119]|nr:hypothetical protein BKA61DRAFT_222356 [Leptodontidium sp. MPI-SDFR-AT-0119]
MLKLSLPSILLLMHTLNFYLVSSKHLTAWGGCALFTYPSLPITTLPTTFSFKNAIYHNSVKVKSQPAAISAILYRKRQFTYYVSTNQRHQECAAPTKCRA